MRTRLPTSDYGLKIGIATSEENQMRNFTASQTCEYEKSNSLDRIPCLEGLDTGCKAQILNGASDAVTRTMVGQKFINEVCARAGVSTVLL